MSCDPALLEQATLFSGLSPEELRVLAAEVEEREFGPFELIYRRGEVSGAAYVLLEGSVRLTIEDEDNLDVTVYEPLRGELFGFSALLDDLPADSSAQAISPVRLIEVKREALQELLTRRPEAGLRLLGMMGKHLRTTESLVRSRAPRSPNEILEQEVTTGERIADGVARFGGSWKFLGLFAGGMAAYIGLSLWQGPQGWDPYPFILLNLFLSMLAAVQAPVIMMSQNRLDAKDRLRSEMDFDVNRKAEMEIRSLHEKMNEVRMQLQTVERMLAKAGRGKEG